MSGPGCAVGGGPPASCPCCSLLLVAPLAFWVPRVLCWAGLRRGRRPARVLSAPRASGSARRLVVRPGPVAAHGHRSPALRPSGASTPAVRLVLLCVAPSCLLLSNFARNSPVTISVFELASLELQRFWAVFKSDRGKLRADLVSPRLCCRPRAPLPGPPVPPAAYTPVARGVLCVARRIGATSG